MVKKEFCDGCGKDITGRESFEAEIYNPLLEEKEVEDDLCEKCMKELKEHFPKKE